jgi:hypothetical protein
MQYIEFGGFPPGTTGETMDSCNFESTPTDHADAQRGKS